MIAALPPFYIEDEPDVLTFEAMISYLEGTLSRIQGQQVEVITDQGVGYRVRVPRSLLDELPASSSDVQLHTTLLLYNDQFRLYGFQTSATRQLFERLQQASGVGPQLALRLIDALPPGQLTRALQSHDYARLKQVSGVGEKTSRRLCLDLAHRLADWSGTPSSQPSPRPAVQRARSALQQLGYSEQEAGQALRQVRCELTDDQELDVESWIRQGLQHLR